jgi:hypothetical protein
MVKQDLAAGRLIHALPQWLLPDGGIHAVFKVARRKGAIELVFLKQSDRFRQDRVQPLP